MPPIAIIGVAQELASLEPRVTALRSLDTPWGRLITGRWQKSTVEVVLAAVAVGKVGAAMGVQAVIETVQPRLVLNCGSAGALAPDLHVGDIVVGDPVAAHDQGIFLPLDLASRRRGYRSDGFLALGSTLPRGRRRSFRPAPALLQLATRAAKHRSELRCHVGSVVTGDQIIWQDATRLWLRQTFVALAVDTESAAVAQVAHCHGVPWLVIRGISDAADSATAFDYTPLLAYEEDSPPRRLRQWSHILNLALTDPRAIRHIERLRSGVRQAMTSVATLLDALLPLIALEKPE